MLTHATVDQVDEIYRHFYNNKTWFPHIRKDYIKRQVERGCCVYHDGIIITYNKYKRKQRLGSEHANKGDIILHQILNSKEGSGNAGIVLDQFFKMVEAPVWLTVRAENIRAIQFYEKHKMKSMGAISWLKGQMKGIVFLKEV